MQSDPQSSPWLGPICRRSLAAVLGMLLVGSVQGSGQAHVDGGELRIVGPDGTVRGVCPLKHTDVVADVAGYVTRVTVTQTFWNPTEEKIEAVYVFPLPHDAAVDSMVLTVGDRRVVGQILERSEAQRVYRQARAAGHVAGLLDQERPNIFTQSVANIEPGVEVRIEISYVHTLAYRDGWFEFVFPMVVGPRYIPGGGSAPAPMTIGQDTPQVPDGSRITPPVTPPGTRAGHDISLTVHLDAGLEIEELVSVLHDVAVQRDGPGRATIRLAKRDEIPNRDFVLRYRLAAGTIGNAFLTHEDARGRFFTLILQPPQRVAPRDVTPRELIFVLDTSGSMRGFPMGKAKDLLARMVDTMSPEDTFNIITFAGSTRVLWDAPRPSTPENRAAAQRFLLRLQGSGGTEMMDAIQAALNPDRRPEPQPTPVEELASLPGDGRRVAVRLRSEQIERLERPGRYRIRIDRGITIPLSGVLDDVLDAGSREVVIAGRWGTPRRPGALLAERAAWADEPQAPAPSPADGRVRLVVFLTDGYVGNDLEIIDAVRRYARTTRVFSFGIGNSVNRFLLDGMAYAGRGEVEYVTLAGQADAAAERFRQRVLAPVLTDIAIDWGDLPVTEVYPRLVPDLFSSRPIMVHGRLEGEPRGVISIRGRTGSGIYEQQIAVEATAGTQHEAIASLWARAKVADLMHRDPAALQAGRFPDDLRQQILDLGLRFHLLTPFTSFVAVEEVTVTAGGEPTTIRVPVEIPQGVSYEGVFGERRGYAPTGTAFRAPGARGAAMTGGTPWGARTAALVPFNTGPGIGPAPQEFKTLQVAPENARPLVRGAAAAAAKLDPELRSALAAVEQDAGDGNLTVKGVKIVNYRVEILIVLGPKSEHARKSLKNIGFETHAEGHGVRFLIGSIDIRNLRKVAELPGVLAVKSVRN